MGVYSFLDVDAAIEGPGGSFQLGSTSGNSTEGISITPTGDKNIMTIGASGEVMHSLRGDKSGTLTINMLRTSQTNAQLSNLYNYQTTSSQYHGQNTVTIRNKVSGDITTCSDVAFAKSPDNVYAEEGGILVWVFHVGNLDTKLGTGTPEI